MQWWCHNALSLQKSFGHHCNFTRPFNSVAIYIYTCNVDESGTVTCSSFRREYLLFSVCSHRVTSYLQANSLTEALPRYILMWVPALQKLPALWPSAGSALHCTILLACDIVISPLTSRGYWWCVYVVTCIKSMYHACACRRRLCWCNTLWRMWLQTSQFYKMAA